MESLRLTRVPDNKLAAFPDPYWLCRCERWQVFAPEGRVGSVRSVLYGSRLDVPEALLVERGLFRKQTVVASTVDVERILPEQQRLILRRSPLPDDGLPDVLKRRAQSARELPSVRLPSAGSAGVAQAPAGADVQPTDVRTRLDSGS